MTFVAQSVRAFPTGEKEQFMANTGIAAKDSTGSVLYNPAGLASVRENRLSGTANSYFSLSQSEKGATKSRLYTTTGSVPGLVVSANKVGSSTVAFSVNVPYSLEAPAKQTVGGVQYETNARRERLSVGASYGRAIHRVWDFGASIFAHKEDRRFTTTLFFDNPAADQGFTYTANVKETTYAASATAGAVYHLEGVTADPIRLGLVLRAPSVQLKQTSSFSVRGTEVDATGDYIPTNEDSAAKTKTGSPFEVGFGVNVPIGANAQILFDSNYISSFKSEAIDPFGNVRSSDNSGRIEAGIGASIKVFETYETRFGYRHAKDLKPEVVADKTAGAVDILSVGLHATHPNYDTGLGFYYEAQTDKYSSGGQSVSGPHEDMLELTAVLLSGTFRF